jgi:Ca2+-binding RTX toxin-like protein
MDASKSWNQDRPCPCSTLCTNDAADDTIRVENSILTALGTGTLSAAAFARGTAAAEADDRIIYDSATGALYYDADGAGGQIGQFQFATLVSRPGNVTNADFLVI